MKFAIFFILSCDLYPPCLLSCHCVSSISYTTWHFSEIYDLFNFGKKFIPPQIEFVASMNMACMCASHLCHDSQNRSSPVRFEAERVADGRFFYSTLPATSIMRS